ncbi:beta-lactamase/transpeptidase-like protein [Aspergillus homomorphus CBS 101889]|uniref:Beta-lactamase/transpeptidase-like protein n=1 Tax=Aspergillus homomorphus (strain CBS 101889) TaxID=1450537 RepID=A0A395HM07_ASPHC|nr:beta-lactamase/transpeptidase-like protein [Aspergillus homomorphus CBS 101889]RAL08529.1 beta-lactamase/transpeptidase-like protein [Aspergillus homomorphus CBS 101889]
MSQDTVQHLLETIPLRYSGPGGAIAILKDGHVLGQRVWGYADVEQRLHLTPETRMPICSITKQFVCALLLDLKRNPTPAMLAAGTGDIDAQFEVKLREILHPELFTGNSESGLRLDHLCDMQSGLRDYWAMTALWGAKPEDEFRVDRDCAPMLARTKSFQFAPGTEYSYCNVNFHVLARVVEGVAGETLGKLLVDRVLGPAGMRTAELCPDNDKLPGPCRGYEGTEETGYVAAVNRMEWSGDAGLVASLEDMVAWEKHLHRLYTDKDSWYYRVAQPNTFADGTPAPYHYGLSRGALNGVDTLGHAGALRGWRSHRRHALQAGLSVIVMINHEADVMGAVDYALRALLQQPALQYAPVEPSPAWTGSFLDKETQLAVRIRAGSRPGELVFAYAGHPETIRLMAPTHGEAPGTTASIEGDILRMHRVKENRKLEAHRLIPHDKSFKDPSLAGTYVCAEAESTFHCWGEAGLLYGELDGYLGRGTATAMRYLGDDVWVLACPRGLDAPAPGDWTVVFHRDESGVATGFRIGCWLARGIEFVRA